MATLAQLHADLEKLKAARRSGVARVRFGDREVDYRSDREIERAIAAIEAEIGNTKPRIGVVRSTKGW